MLGFTLMLLVDQLSSKYTKGNHVINLIMKNLFVKLIFVNLMLKTLVN